MSNIIPLQGGADFAEGSERARAKAEPTSDQMAANQAKAQRALMKEYSDLIGKHFISAFERTKTGHRVKDILQSLMALGRGRKTITNSIVARGLDQKDWSADFRATSVGKWDPADIYAGVFQAAMPLLGDQGPVILGIDDTGITKEGEQIECVGWIHNPLVPKYVRPAIQWGVPILHAALLIQGKIVHRPTAITVAFEPIQKEKAQKRGAKSKKAKPDLSKKMEEQPAPVKRGRPTKAETERRRAEREALIKDGQGGAEGAVADQKLKATEVAVRVIWRVRAWMDQAGMQDRNLLVVGDSSYTNATVMQCLPHHTSYLGRTRPDSKLQAIGPATKTGTYKYGPELPTPKKMAVEHLLDTKLGKFHYAGAHRELRFLELGPVFRKTSTRKMPLRLLILEPVPYSRGKGNPKGYNYRAYLLTTDLRTPPEELVAAYLMRWELEVVHRIWKTDLGIGEAQVRKHRLAAAMAANYALLVIANLKALGEERNPGYGPLTKWAANHREWLAEEKKKVGKPIPRYRATPTEISYLVAKSLAKKGTKVFRLVA